MRCSPQVYGVVYDCLDFLKKDLDSILNKYHFNTLVLDGKEYANIDIFADSEVLKGDFLVCSLNEIGSMSFLRA
jgi:histidine ammonia-lyase